MSREEIRIVLQGLSAQVQRDFRADIEGFFGSRARDDARDDSDLGREKRGQTRFSNCRKASQSPFFASFRLYHKLFQL